MPRGRPMEQLERELGAMMFEVPGDPQTQGSMRAIVRGRRAVVIHDKSRLVPWRDSIAAVARSKGWGRGALLDGAVKIELAFFVTRPALHFGKTGLRKFAPEHPHTNGGDLDKLVRAVGDALTGVVWRDDRRIVSCHAVKQYCDTHGVEPGVMIAIERLSPELFDARAAAKPRTTRKSA